MATRPTPVMNTMDHSFDWDDLLDCINEQSVIPIIGKELITLRLENEEVPLERYIAERLAAALEIPPDQLSTDFDPNEVAIRYIEKGGGSQKIYRKINAILNESSLPVPATLKKLAAITDFRLYVSLTFDSLLEEAISQKRFKGEWKAKSLVYSILRQKEDLPPDSDLKTLDPPHVYHLFGIANTVSDYAVTDEDILEFLHSLQSKSNQPEILFDKFLHNHLLFIGCGYENWLERFVIRCITNERLTGNRETSEFVADDRARNDVSLNFFLKQYRPEVFLSGSPAEFVNELYERWSEQHPSATPEKVSQTPAPKMGSGGIFLSYAHEDRQRVQNMKNALESANLDVWFDQGDLRPGDAWDLQIRGNIRHCAVFIPFISRRAQQRLDGYFRKEWKWAIDQDPEKDESLRFIQPVILDDTADGAKHIPPYFWERHCSRFPEGQPTPEFVEQLKQLVRKLREREAGY